MTLDRTKAQNFFDHNCKNMALKDQTGAEDECDDRRKTLARTPEIYAIYKTFESWNFCSLGLCGSFIKTIADRFIYGVMLLGIGYLVLMSAWGRRLFLDHRADQYSSYNLPCSYQYNQKSKKIE